MSYTDTDVELVAARLWEIDEALWSPGQRVPWRDADADERPPYSTRAVEILSALAAAGRLTPTGGETRTDWGVRLTWDDGRGYDDRPAENEADARYLVDYHRRQKVRQAEVGRLWLGTPSLITRTCTLGPWQPVETEGSTE